jgi:hypothetical protein
MYNVDEGSWKEAQTVWVRSDDFAVESQRPSGLGVGFLVAAWMLQHLSNAVRGDASHPARCSGVPVFVD